MKDARQGLHSPLRHSSLDRIPWGICEYALAQVQTFFSSSSAHHAAVDALSFSTDTPLPSGGDLESFFQP
jgi:hypothetical protein